MVEVNSVEELIKLCGESKVQTMLCDYFMTMFAKATLCDKLVDAIKHNTTSEDLKVLIDTFGGDT